MNHLRRSFTKTARLTVMAGALMLMAGPTAGFAAGKGGPKSPPAPTWTQVRNPGGPSPRVNHSLVYDPAHQRTVLFGGFPGAGTVWFNDTWEWNGRRWTDISSAVRPPARHLAAIAYDAARETVVMFGGTGGAGDTWELDGATWTQVFPTVSPRARYGSAMAYDGGLGKVVLFGGGYSEAGIAYDTADTWTWDGSTWEQLSPVNSPPARRIAKMAYDAANGQIVLFGGWRVAGMTGSADTWVFDGINWTELSPAVSPPERTTTAMAYDSARARVVLFGGGDNDHGYLGDTWEWDGATATWSQIQPATSPSTRGYTSMVYDAARARTVLFGGYSGTGGCCLFNAVWEYQGAAN